MSKGQALSAVLIPALVFQSVVIAGGYGTGRELVEFFLFMGPWAGLLGMVVSAIVWSIVSSATFEFARRFHAYDYRVFFQKLLGRGWFLFEIAYLALTLIVLGVIASSAGNILVETLNIPYQWGVIGISIYICLMVWRGSRAIERALSFWSISLYVVFTAFLIACVANFGSSIKLALAQDTLQSGWFQQGIAYAGYNLGLIPAVLFAVKRCQTQAQAVSAGILAGLFTILPGMGFFVAMCGLYPAILEHTVPSTYMLNLLGSWPLSLAFHFILLGTITDTGTGVIHAINQRIQSAFNAKGLIFPSIARPLVAFACLIVTFGLSQIGLVTLISKGYGTITWAIILIYVVPLLTIGLYKMVRPKYESVGSNLDAVMFEK